jgi:hypothetical protein
VNRYVGFGFDCRPHETGRAYRNRALRDDDLFVFHGLADRLRDGEHMLKIR